MTKAMGEFKTKGILSLTMGFKRWQINPLLSLTIDYFFLT